MVVPSEIILSYMPDLEKQLGNFWKMMMGGFFKEENVP